MAVITTSTEASSSGIHVGRKAAELLGYKTANKSGLIIYSAATHDPKGAG